MDLTVRGRAVTWRGFVNNCLRVSLACLGSRTTAVQPWNSQKIVYKTSSAKTAQRGRKVQWKADATCELWPLIFSWWFDRYGSVDNVVLAKSQFEIGIESVQVALEIVSWIMAYYWARGEYQDYIVLWAFRSPQPLLPKGNLRLHLLQNLS